MSSSFWLKRDRSRRTVLSLVKVDATLGQMIDADKPNGDVSPDREGLSAEPASAVYKPSRLTTTGDATVSRASLRLPLKSLDSLTEAIDYYTATGYQIDRIHYHFEQQNFQLLDTTFSLWFK